MKIAVYKHLTPSAGVPILEAFIQSLKEDGHFVDIVTADQLNESFDAAVLWSVNFKDTNRKKVWDYYKDRNIPVIIFEVGALNRNVLWKIGIGNIDNTAEFANKNSPKDRWEYLNIELKPWQLKRGDDILICTQNDQAGHWPTTLTSEEWVKKVVDELVEITNRRIIIRLHPRKPLKQSFHGYKGAFEQKAIQLDKKSDVVDFKKALETTWAVISPSSNPGVESIIAGIPVFCWSNALVAPVGNAELKDLNNPRMPDRTQWIYDFAYTEWTVDEIRAGIPWQRLKPFLTPV